MKKQSAGRRVRREKVRRKKMQVREKVGKSRNTVFFGGFVAPEGWKVGSLKAAGAETSKEMRDEKLHAVVARSTFRSPNVQNTPGPDHFWKLRCRKSARRCGEKHISKSKCRKHCVLGPLTEVEMSKKCTPLWREAHFQVKMYKTHHVRTCTDHFWKLRCRKSARRCGAKHISKSKRTKHTILGPLLEVEMSKKCTLLWHEAHFQVKMYKTHHVRTTFGDSDVVSRGRRKGLWTLSKVSKMWGFLQHFQLQPPLHHTTLQYITLHYNYSYTFTIFYYTTLHYTTLHSITLNYSQLHDTTRHYTPLHYITLHYITLHYTTLHHTTLPYTTLHYTTLHYTIYTSLHYTTTTTAQLHNYTPLHSTTVHYTKLHYTTLHYATLHYTTLHYTTLHYLPLHFTTLHYTTLNYTTTTTTLHYTPLHSTTLNYTTRHYIKLHYTTFHYTSLHYTTLPYTEWHCTTDRQVDR